MSVDHLHQPHPPEQPTEPSVHIVTARVDHLHQPHPPERARHRGGIACDTVSITYISHTRRNVSLTKTSPASLPRCRSPTSATPAGTPQRREGQDRQRVSITYISHTRRNSRTRTPLTIRDLLEHLRADKVFSPVAQRSRSDLTWKYLQNVKLTPFRAAGADLCSGWHSQRRDSVFNDR